MAKSLRLGFCILAVAFLPSLAFGQTWTPTEGDPTVDRANIEATLLPNDLVLVAGGIDSSSPSGRTAGAELFNLETGLWTTAFPLQVSRDKHTATLLLTGLVLVVGGERNPPHTTTAELYDPDTGTWTFTTNDLSEPRLGHTATLLPNGKVLVVGGASPLNGVVLRPPPESHSYTVEIYDPVSRMWSPRADLKVSRTNHVATFLPAGLPDGDGGVLAEGGVLVSGGGNLDGVAIKDAEIYDVARDMWRCIHPTQYAHYHMQETGAPWLPTIGKVLVAGGVDDSHTISDKAELYDPVLGTWSETNQLHEIRSNFTMTLLGDCSVLVAGGVGGTFRNTIPLDTAEIYHPDTGTWSETPTRMNSARQNAAAALLPDGRVLVVGGWSNAGPVRTSEIFSTPSSRGICSLIAWSNPSDISYGTALSATQLNAAASVPGTFSYSPAAGTVLEAGLGQLLSVDFVRDDAPTYISATASTTINVLPVPLTITADHQTRVLNAPPPELTASYAGFVAGDGPSALTGTLTCTTTAGLASPVGPYPITCTGETSTNYTISYMPGELSVVYASAGASCLGEPGHAILQPVNRDGTSVFKQKATVPVKFRVCGATGESVGTPGVVANFRLVQIINGTVAADVNETVASTTPDSTFRWDASAQQWIFNLKTKNLLANATYVYRVTLNDGSAIDFKFGLK